MHVVIKYHGNLPMRNHLNMSCKDTLWNGYFGLSKVLLESQKIVKNITRFILWILISLANQMETYPFQLSWMSWKQHLHVMLSSPREYESLNLILRHLLSMTWFWCPKWSSMSITGFKRKGKMECNMQLALTNDNRPNRIGQWIQTPGMSFRHRSSGKTPE